MENALVRVPSLEDMRGHPADQRPRSLHAGRRVHPRPESDVRGFWVAAGFCAHGLAGAGGMGKLVAEWIVEGVPVARRVGDGLAAVRPPLPQPRVHARPHRRDLLDVLRRQVPGARARGRAAAAPLARRTRGCRSSAPRSARSRGGSAPTGSSRTRERGDESLRPRGWAGRLWSPAIGAEHRACRETAALFDETSFAKIEVAGEGAAAFLERLCDNRVARDVGAITYTQMLNPRGGIECDFTVTRLAEDRFRIVTGTAFGQHDLAWIRAHAPDDGSVTVDDVTSKLRLPRPLGPARARRPAAAHDATTSDDFSYMRAREIAVGPVPCLALRVTYVGELGWELYCPTEFGLRLWDVALGGRARPRARRGRIQGDRLASPGEGLPGLGQRHHARRDAVRGGARVRGQARQGRLHRPRALLRANGAGTRRLVVPRPRRRAFGGARVGAGSYRRRHRAAASRAAATATPSSVRSRTPTCRQATRRRAARWRSRSSANGSPARSRPSRCSIQPASAYGVASAHEHEPRAHRPDPRHVDDPAETGSTGSRVTATAATKLLGNT